LLALDHQFEHVITLVKDNHPFASSFAKHPNSNRVWKILAFYSATLNGNVWSPNFDDLKMIDLKLCSHYFMMSWRPHNYLSTPCNIWDIGSHINDTFNPTLVHFVNILSPKHGSFVIVLALRWMMTTNVPFQGKCHGIRLALDLSRWLVWFFPIAWFG
jgi:hypothetical protein